MLEAVKRSVPKLSVFFVSAYTDFEYAKAAIANGAREGYIFKACGTGGDVSASKDGEGGMDAEPKASQKGTADGDGDTEAEGRALNG